jgi:ABC-2 type transport system ATP-binding protein
VSFERVRKSFGPVHALDGVDLNVRRGETVALLGRNGAGKSTAVGLMLGLEEPDTGTVRLFGGQPSAAVVQGRVGAMLQDGRAVRRVTVRELVSFVASAYPRPLPVAEAIELAGLAGLDDRRVDRLSGGQVQRVSFAVAIAGGPELIVLDEPTSALDVEARRAFWASMRAYADRGNTVLFSTHHLEEADAFADRIVVLHRGRVVADGSGRRLKESAGARLVAIDLAGRSPRGLELLPGVRDVQVRPGRALLRTTDADATVMALAGLGMVRGIEVSGPTLEDAFLALTRAADTGTESGAHDGTDTHTDSTTGTGASPGTDADADADKDAETDADAESTGRLEEIA